MAAPLAGILSGIGKAAAGAGKRIAASETVRGAVGRGVKSLFGGRQQGQDQEIIPAKVSVIEGFAGAIKGASGGGGGAIVRSGGPSVSTSSSAIVKTGDTFVDKLEEIKIVLQRMLSLEMQSLKNIENQILNFARSSERKGRQSEEEGQETAKKKSKSVEDNPIIKQGKKAFGGIFDFIKELVVGFIKYKVLDWLSKPENVKKIERTIDFFKNLFKTLKLIFDVVMGPQMALAKLMQDLISGGFNLFVNFIGGVVNFFSLKWLPNIDGFIKTLQDLPKIFTEMIPNAINGIINFFTKTLFGAAEDEGEKAVSASIGEVSAESSKSTEGSSGVETETTQNKESNSPNILSGISSMIDNTIGATPIGIVAKGAMGAMGAIGNAIGGMFGGGKKDTPQLREGGIVGPSNQSSNVSVEPLDKLGEVSGIGSVLKNTIKMFMELLTMPFKLVGAAIIALIMNTVGKIPGVGPFITPIIDNIVSKFGLPSSIKSLVMGGSEQKKPDSEPTKSDKTKPTKSDKPEPTTTTSTPSAATPAPAPTLTPPDTTPAPAPPTAVSDTTPTPTHAPSTTSTSSPNINGDISGTPNDDQTKSKGGWIVGPQSGYPVSLDGGNSVSFIGHGTEWVGFKKSAGGGVSTSAFVVPFDTPATRSNGGLTKRRWNEAKSGGYVLPKYARGGRVNDNKRGSGDEGLKTKTSGGSVVTSRYGSRWGRWHAGTDIAGVPIGTPIKTLTGGKVLYASSYGGYGNTVDLQVSSNKMFRFAHLDGFAVKTGQVVPPGGLIGTLGNTGVGTGPHLHFEHRKKLDFGKGSSMDPEKTGAISEMVVGGKPISSIKPDDTSQSTDDTMIGGPGETSMNAEDTKPPEPYVPSTGDLSALTDLFKMLNPTAAPSSKFPEIQTENLISTAFSSSSLMSGSGTTMIDASSTVSSSTSTMSADNPLGNNLPKDGYWSIFKTNL
jgi:murein DD-endopeptidase MepM/ murein hydrolase activator NlpD